MATRHQNDLPLLANTKDIKIRHFILELSCDLSKNIFKGYIFLILDSDNTGHIFDIQNHQRGCRPFDLRRHETNKKYENDVMRGSRDNYAVEKEHNAINIQKDHNIVLNDKNTIYFEDANASYLEESTDLLLESEQTEPFVMILDSCNLKVKSVTEPLIDIPFSHQTNDLLNCKETQTQPDFTQWRRNANKLHFDVGEWCIKIWKDGAARAADFPKLICIEYETTPMGRSLRWVNDQDGR